ncbi:unnamed protein product, partial [Prorocentrum cordatum]
GLQDEPQRSLQAGSGAVGTGSGSHQPSYEAQCCGAMSSGGVPAVRQRQDLQAVRVTPPSTPRCGAGAPTTPPPLRHARVEPLLQGLERNCPERVRRALGADPHAAKVPFLERRFDWPLCAAVRLGCSEEIVRLLTAHGAKADVTDALGHSPLQLLSSRAEANITSGLANAMRGLLGADEWAAQLRESLAQLELGVAAALLTAGADPEACHGDPCRGHRSAAELARRARQDHLVGLYEAHSATTKGMVTPGCGLRSAPLGPGGHDTVLVGPPPGAGELYRGHRASPRVPPRMFPRGPVANHTLCKPHPLESPAHGRLRTF